MSHMCSVRIAPGSRAVRKWGRRSRAQLPIGRLRSRHVQTQCASVTNPSDDPRPRENHHIHDAAHGDGSTPVHTGFSTALERAQWIAFPTACSHKPCHSHHSDRARSMIHIGQMASPSQILANERNARASTGPSTPEGKTASRRNATRHGLSGIFSVLPHEDHEEFDQLASTLRAEFQPAGDTETIAHLMDAPCQAWNRENRSKDRERHCQIGYFHRVIHC